MAPINNPLLQMTSPFLCLTLLELVFFSVRFVSFRSVLVGCWFVGSFLLFSFCRVFHVMHININSKRTLTIPSLLPLFLFFPSCIIQITDQSNIKHKHTCFLFYFILFCHTHSPDTTPDPGLWVGEPHAMAAPQNYIRG